MMHTPRFAPFVLAAIASTLAAQKSPDVRLTTGRAAGTATTSDPALASGNGAVYAAYTDNRSGTDDVYFNVSTDAGYSWPANDVRLSHGPAGSIARRPRLAASRTSPTVVAVWLDQRNGGTDVYCNRSLDGGATWLPNDVRLDSSAALGAGAASDPRLALSSSSVYVVWTDARGTGTNVRCNLSHDNGATWLAADIVLNGTSGTANNADVVAADPFIHVAWNDTRNGQADVFYVHSANSGASWLPEARLNVGAAAGSAACTAPRLSLSQQHVYATWTDVRNAGTTGTTGDVFFIASHNSGTSWAATDTRLNAFGGSAPAGGCDAPHLNAAGSAVHVAWSDGRASTVNHDIYANSSADAGVTWRGDVRLDTGDAAGASPSDNPRVVASSSFVQVAWEDRRNNPTSHVFSNHSVDGGATWLSGDVRLDPGTLSGSQGVLRPQISLSNNSVHVLWTDDRTNPFTGNDAFYNLANGYQAYGAGTPGMFGGIPTLTGGGTMVLGGSAEVAISNAPGGAAAALVIGIGDGARIAQPLIGGTLLVSPLLSLFVTLSGPSGIPGIGANTTTFPVPINPSLLGITFAFQALCLDSGAPQGVSMSAGVAAWIG